MRYSALVVITGLEVIFRAGYHPVFAPRVFGKLAEIIAGGGDLAAVLEGITEESMHEGEEEAEADKAEGEETQGETAEGEKVEEEKGQGDKAEEVAADLAKLKITVDPATNKIAEQFADRIAWALATGQINAPKWTCGCEEGDEGKEEEEAGGDKENDVPAVEVDEVEAASPPAKKLKEEAKEEAQCVPA